MIAFSHFLKKLIDIKLLIDVIFMVMLFDFHNSDKSYLR